MMNHKHLFGFDNEKELIYIFKGYDFLNLTSSITEYFEKSPAQYTKHWGWYINDLNKIKSRTSDSNVYNHRAIIPISAKRPLDEENNDNTDRLIG